MIVIVCVDNEGGMMFNNRRQSRDREVIKDIMNNLEGKLWIRSYSEELFVDYLDRVIIDNNLLDNIEGKQYCFIEDITLEGYVDRIDSVIMYNWNKRYPKDMWFEVDMSNFEHTASIDIEGYSHEKITKDTYIRKE